MPIHPILLPLLLTSTSALAAPHFVKVSVANVRVAPAAKADLACQIPIGSEVKATAKGDWLAVEWRACRGFSSAALFAGERPTLAKLKAELEAASGDKKRACSLAERIAVLSDDEKEAKAMSTICRALGKKKRGTILLAQSAHARCLRKKGREAFVTEPADLFTGAGGIRMEGPASTLFPPDRVLVIKSDDAYRHVCRYAPALASGWTRKALFEKAGAAPVVAAVKGEYGRDAELGFVVGGTIYRPNGKLFKSSYRERKLHTFDDGPDLALFRTKEQGRWYAEQGNHRAANKLFYKAIERGAGGGLRDKLRDVSGSCTEWGGGTIDLDHGVPEGDTAPLHKYPFEGAPVVGKLRWDDSVSIDERMFVNYPEWVYVSSNATGASGWLDPSYVDGCASPVNQACVEE